VAVRECPYRSLVRNPRHSLHVCHLRHFWLIGPTLKNQLEDHAKFLYTKHIAATITRPHRANLPCVNPSVPGFRLFY
jgi:hypothetical protein